MDLLLGVILLVFGVVTLVRKELTLSSSRISRGAPARTAGIILVLALPVAYVLQTVLGVAERSGLNLVSEAARGTLTYVVLLVMTAIAVAIAFTGTRDAS